MEKKLNFKKLSILGLALLATSAVVAKLTPENKESKKFDVDGRIVDNVGTSSVASCLTAAALQNCHKTATAGDAGSSSAGGADETNGSSANQNTTVGDNS